MNLTRRGLLGILAAGVAPAIIHNAMPLWVPKKIIGAYEGILDDVYLSHASVPNNHAGLLGADGKEISGDGYARAPVSADGGIVFPAAAGTWGVVTHILWNGQATPILPPATFGILKGDQLRITVWPNGLRPNV